MKNTRIPLDILYFDDQRRLVSQQRDVPPCSAGNRCPSYPSSAPARYVLELNAGQAMEIGLQDGAEMHFGHGRSEERRVGKECGRKCRSGWYTTNSKTKKTKK